MGSGELGILYRKKRNTLTFLVRNNLKQDNKGAVEIGWSYPLSGGIKGYVQFFDGYGESLIDYDHRNTRIGAGFLLGVQREISPIVDRYSDPSPAHAG